MGTVLNGIKIEDETPISSGSVITAGPYEIHFFIGPPIQKKSAPQPSAPLKPDPVSPKTPPLDTVPGSVSQEVPPVAPSVLKSERKEVPPATPSAPKALDQEVPPVAPSAPKVSDQEVPPVTPSASKVSDQEVPPVTPSMPKASDQEVPPVAPSAPKVSDQKVPPVADPSPVPGIPGQEIESSPPAHRAVKSSRKGFWRYYAPPDKIRNLDHFLEPSIGNLIEVLVCWKERVLRAYYFSKAGEVFMGSDKSCQIKFPNMMNQASYKLMSISSGAKVFLSQAVKGVVVSRARSINAGKSSSTWKSNGHSETL